MCIDFLTLDKSKDVFENVLAITRFAVAIPTKDQSAKTTATALFNEFIFHYGAPLSIHSDQGGNFNGESIRELCSLIGKQFCTTVYHTFGNGICEMFNITLIDMLGTLEDDRKKDWRKHSSTLVHVHNFT